jgi:hypothetical protein
MTVIDTMAFAEPWPRTPKVEPTAHGRETSLVEDRLLRCCREDVPRHRVTNYWLGCSGREVAGDVSKEVGSSVHVETDLTVR